MINRQATIDVLKVIRGDIRRNGSRNYHTLLSVCTFINSLFCDCKYIEYWVFDLNFGQNECMTELGFELKGIDTIDKFVDFLFSKHV